MPPRAQLIDASGLAAELGTEDLVVLDTTAFLRREVPEGPYTVESGRASYESGHIPGAVFADIPAELSDVDSPFRFTLPDAGHFERAVGSLGVGDGSRVVVYAQESPIWASRMWWLLRYFGFDSVRLLDGGLGAWKGAGYELETGGAQPRPARFTARPRRELLATTDEVVALLGGEPACLVNALTPHAFRGLGVYAYSRPGRIPGSVSVPAQSLLDPGTWRFRPPEELRRELSGLLGLDPAVPLIAYCGAGISATVDVFALSMLGRDDVRLYDGSLTEWSADPSLPLEIG